LLRYHTYGTPELAQSVIEALGEGSESNLQQVALIANHGAVAVGSDLEEAL
jgi:ribulose-5-phosphate 4-epimerase/fuculose-1-phosphate aldolase